MKKMIINIALFLIMGVGAMACKKEENTPNGKSYVRFTIDGTEQVLDYADPAANSTNCLYHGAIGRIIIVGIKQQGSVISQLFLSFGVAVPTVGQTYDMSESYSDCLYAPVSTDITQSYTIEEGTLTVTKVKSIGSGDYAINGTFSGVAEDPDGGLHTITNGVFYDVRTE